MKKLIALATALVMMTGILSGCKGTEGDSGSDSGLKVAKKDFSLTYANWNLGTEEANNIERKMVKAFEDKTGITVKISESIDINNYEESLATLAASSKMPDVFMIPNIPLGLENEWMLDLSSFVKEDADWAKIPDAIEVATHYKEGVYAIPAGFFMQGYFVNDDLFNDNNLNKLSLGCSFDDFLNGIKKLSNLNKKTVGILNEKDLIEWYASSKNNALGWFTWDNEKYNLNSAEFKEGMQKLAEIRKGKYSFDSLNADERASLNAETDILLWNQGQAGLRWAGTWEIPDMVGTSSFTKRFIGIPGGRTSVVGDFMAISPSSRHQAEAFELAKWMTFGPDGIQKRMELDTDGTQFNTLPLTKDQNIIDAYFERNNFPGLKEAFYTLDNSIVESTKIIPGYDTSRWLAKTGRKIAESENANIAQLLEAAWFGQASYSDYADQANKIANDAHANAVTQIETIY